MWLRKRVEVLELKEKRRNCKHPEIKFEVKHGSVAGYGAFIICRECGEILCANSSYDVVLDFQIKFYQNRLKELKGERDAIRAKNKQESN